MKARDGLDARETRKPTRRVRRCTGRHLTSARDFSARIHRRRSRTPLHLKSSLWHPFLFRQTEMKTGSASFLFRGEELLEKALPRFLRDPAAIVAHRYGDHSVAIGIRSKFDDTAAR